MTACFGIEASLVAGEVNALGTANEGSRQRCKKDVMMVPLC